MSDAFEELRDISVELVLVALGFERDPADPTCNWRGDLGRISTGRRQGRPESFFSHDSDEGGGGAIDAAMVLGGMTFREAIGWLRDHVCRGASNMTQDEISTRQRQEKVAMHPESVRDTSSSARNQVLQYLSSRGVDRVISSLAYDGGYIAALRYKRFLNAAFPLAPFPAKVRGSGAWSLRGMGNVAFKSVVGKKGCWAWPTQAAASGLPILISESPIDALAAYSLACRQCGLLSDFEALFVGKPEAMLMATIGSIGSQTINDIIGSAATAHQPIVLALDNDDAGLKTAELFRALAAQKSKTVQIIDLSAVLKENFVKDFAELAVNCRRKPGVSSFP